MPSSRDAVAAVSPCVLEGEFLSQFRELKPPPPRAYLWGTWPAGPRVGIVGSRGAGEEGLEDARCLARALAEAGVCVVSGGARGIDTAAHEGALEAGGATLVVAPLWFERAFPRENRELFQRIVDRGGGYLCLSEKAAPPIAATFFRRNAALACLSTLLVVGQSRFRSGSRNTVGHAVAQRRPVFVLPSRFGDPRGRGSNALLGRVARAVTTVEEVLRSLEEPAWPGVEEGLALLDREAGILAPLARKEKSSQARREKEPEKRMAPEIPGPRPKAGTGNGDRVLLAVFDGATTVDEVAQRTELAAEVVFHEVLLLTLGGRLREDERGLLRYDPRSHE